ncbi:DUF4145 domain-containing protein [uncultured Sphingomonas sp.]|uniref:DUF4145 domain-containing protein n=1 Tax=uncultured Sphingomonas sp. TaxID=158754 RepID=UPI0025F7AF4E|nr:DUF4145 domain-containing protein [uncultured Sphingomonas sp.]
MDELIATRLPTLAMQRHNLLRWMAEILDDDRLGSVRAPAYNTLAAVVGARDGQRVSELLDQTLSDGHIKMTDDGGWGITAKGWAEFEKLEPRPDEPVETETQLSTRPKVIVAQCPVCGPNRRAEVVASYTERNPPDGLVFEIIQFNVLKCGGCGTLYVQREAVFSEDEEHEQNPISGEWETTLRPTVSYWPEYARRSRPEWFAALTDEISRQLLDETYGAINAGLLTLAGMGVRAVLDRAFELAGADAGGRFDQKLSSLRDRGIIGDDEHATFVVLTDAGSAAVHRGWRPELEQLETALIAAEDFLNRVTIMPGRIATLQQAVPPRPPRPRRGG